jgi:hypothetical protein
MNKDLKMLLISIALMFVAVTALYIGNKFECGQKEYQNLNGTQYKFVCEPRPDPNCWKNYHTEDAAIRACEGKQ